MTLRHPEPGSFEHLLVECRVDPASLLRLSNFPATEPWWSRGAYRFDGPPATEPNSFGTCYLSDSLAVAFAESVIHESSRFVSGHYEIAQAELARRHVVRFTAVSGSSGAAKTELVLADLTGAALKLLGLNNDISSGNDYDMPMLWAQAIHAANPKWDGVRYVSRQHNGGTAVALFERSGLTKSTHRALAPAELDSLCDLFNVTVLPTAPPVTIF